MTKRDENLKTNAVQQVNNPDVMSAYRRDMIAEAAYYIAENRGFSGEYDLDNWLEAERMIDQTSE